MSGKTPTKEVGQHSKANQEGSLEILDVIRSSEGIADASSLRPTITEKAKTKSRAQTALPPELMVWLEEEQQKLMAKVQQKMVSVV